MVILFSTEPDLTVIILVPAFKPAILPLLSTDTTPGLELE